MMSPQHASTRGPLRMGELAVGSAGDQFTTLLGSCIGLAMFDTHAQVGGLAHILLPSSTGHSGPPGRFVDTAVAELIRQLKTLGADASRLEAKFAGGANMFASTSTRSIGEQNQDAIRHQLDSHSVSVVANHCGGTQGRKMTLIVASSQVRIEVVGSHAIDI